jgi:hypothetical protein
MTPLLVRNAPGAKTASCEFSTERKDNGLDSF